MFEISEKFPHAASSPYSKENKTPLDFWNDVANGEAGTQYDWEHIFSRYAAAVDFPTCCMWRELMSAYPDAKVILTVHPRGGTAWYESTVSTIYFSETMWQWKVLQLAPPFGRKGGGLVKIGLRQIFFPPRPGPPEEFASLVTHIFQNVYLNRECIRIDGGIRGGFPG